jgi:beta-lactam-binding protein with PASTA domain
MHRACLAVFLVLALGCTGDTAPPPPPPPSPSIVPLVIGDKVAGARTAVRKTDLRIDVLQKVASDRKGTVIAQSPRGGSELPGGGTVRITVSKGWPTVPILPFLGVSVEKAKAIIRRAGFRVGGTVLQHDAFLSEFAAGKVVDTKPSCCKPIAPRTPIVLVVVASANSPGGGCTPGYDPCLPPRSDYDCAGGTGDGPYFVHVTEHITGPDISTKSSWVTMHFH